MGGTRGTDALRSSHCVDASSTSSSSSSSEEEGVAGLAGQHDEEETRRARAPHHRAMAAPRKAAGLAQESCALLSSWLCHGLRPTQLAALEAESLLPAPGQRTTFCPTAVYAHSVSLIISWCLIRSYPTLRWCLSPLGSGRQYRGGPLFSTGACFRHRGVRSLNWCCLWSGAIVWVVTVGAGGRTAVGQRRADSHGDTKFTGGGAEADVADDPEACP